MNKVILPKEVAEAIESFRAKGCSNFTIMRMGHGAIHREPDMTIKRWAFDGNGEGTPDLLMSALVNGYEVEKSPEDKLREYFASLAREDWRFINGQHNCGSSPAMRKIEAVLKTLDILGIKIEGVNA